MLFGLRCCWGLISFVALVHDKPVSICWVFEVLALTTRGTPLTSCIVFEVLAITTLGTPLTSCRRPCWPGRRPSQYEFSFWTLIMVWVQARVVWLKLLEKPSQCYLVEHVKPGCPQGPHQKHGNLLVVCTATELQQQATCNCVWGASGKCHA